LNVSLQRLSTGLRINTGRDDPAGLIASEMMRAEKKAISAAISNAAAADNMVGVAESGLGEVSSLLLDLEDLVDRSANDAALGATEIQANQLQIDSILSSINRISSSVSYKGNKLLNGTYDYTLSGTGGSVLDSIQVQGAKLIYGVARQVVVEKVLSAQAGELVWSSTGAGGATDGTLFIEVTGNYGTEQISFGSATSLAKMADTVNASKEMTGVSAVALGSAGLAFYSSGYGSSQFVSVTKINGTSSSSINNVDGRATSKDFGRDAQMRINGVDAITDGLNATVRSSALNLTVTLKASANDGTGSYTFGITGGGATFSLAPDLGLAGYEGIGLGNVAATSLGNPAIGRLSTLGSGQANQLTNKNFATAQRILRSAQDQISSLRGRIGAFQLNTLKSTINALNVAFENTTAAESAIRDTDYAMETSNLTRAQILVSAATSTLQLANRVPQNVLALLQGA
jgi:flagellin